MSPDTPDVPSRFHRWPHHHALSSPEPRFGHRSVRCLLWRLSPQGPSDAYGSSPGRAVARWNERRCRR
ncbi:hypothetical protein DR88_5121 [Klebsiella pneumoniae]|nr:hypothetical protein DR88_5121 [Klebsiella pneumoniae]